MRKLDTDVMAKVSADILGKGGMIDEEKLLLMLNSEADFLIPNDLYIDVKKIALRLGYAIKRSPTEFFYVDKIEVLSESEHAKD